MDNETIYVIGHRSPDTDSVCSAIGLAELKRAQGMENVHAARAGDLNPQTAFILSRLGIEPPVYLADVYPRARDVMTVDVKSVGEDVPLSNVMALMRAERIRFVPVLDSGGRLKGVLTLMDLARRYMANVGAEGGRSVDTTLANIVKTLDGEAVTDSFGEGLRTLSVYVGAMAEPSFLKILKDTEPAGCAVVVGDRADIQLRCAEKGVGLILVTGGLDVAPGVAEAASKNKASIVKTPFDTSTAAQMLRLSTPASAVADGGMGTALPGERVDELKFRVGKTKGLVVLDEDGRLEGVVTKSNFLKPPSTSLILVDHNELSQAVAGAGEVEIVEVVDHHRIGSFQSAQAISFTCDPVGSTSTLVAERYRGSGLPIEKEIAGLLLAGVLSDTVMLKSPTTTERDSALIPWLEEKSGLDHAEFGKEIFSATSSIKKRGSEAVVTGDYKEFEAGGRSFGIGQVETIGFEEFYEEKEALLAELKKLASDKRLAFSALLVTDIVYGDSLLLATGEKPILFSLAYPREEENVWELKGVISRKKQVVPHILSVFGELFSK